jgi:tRNA A-37 threonylcarbamoyl transferase component Bud32/uncharacterized RDD family membrane protein YckC
MSSDRNDVDAVGETISSEASDALGAALGATATDYGRTPADRSINASAGDLTGRSLAHFQLDALIGRGGMGEVYRATDTALERVVAIKVLPRSVAEDARLRERFFREARAQARLQHSHVCHIYYIGDEDGLLFFAMEHIDGESLQAMLERRGALPVTEALELCRMAALGLREAHAQGFTHRDVKPSNLMVDKNGVLKVVDFGLVTRPRERAEAGPAATSLAHTAIVGTPLYMAPEQGRGEEVDLRADVYALGATLHHLVSGKPPFAGATPREVVTKHESEARPPINLKRRRGPAPIDVLCDRMMAKDPANRFDDYDELIGAVERISPAHTRPAGFWVRAFALAIDLLLVRMVLLPLDMLEAGWLGTIFAVGWLAYQVVSTTLFGRTLGKAALELEVVVAGVDRRPGWAISARRFVAQWGPLFVLFGATTAVEASAAPALAAQAMAGVTMVVLLIVYPLEGLLASLNPAKRTFWDRLSGTQVCYRRLR